MVLILLGNIVRHLIIIISHKIGLVFSVMKRDTCRLLSCLARDYHFHCDEKLHNVNFISETVYCFKNSWRFLKFSEALYV